jgi:hypothetical protein
MFIFREKKNTIPELMIDREMQRNGIENIVQERYHFSLPKTV